MNSSGHEHSHEHTHADGTTHSHPHAHDGEHRHEHAGDTKHGARRDATGAELPPEPVQQGDGQEAGTARPETPEAGNR